MRYITFSCLFAKGELLYWVTTCLSTSAILHPFPCTPTILFSVSESPCSHKCFSNRSLFSCHYHDFMYIHLHSRLLTDQTVNYPPLYPHQAHWPSLSSHFSSRVWSASVRLFFQGKLLGKWSLPKAFPFALFKHTINNAFSSATGWVLD